MGRMIDADALIEDLKGSLFYSDAIPLVEDAPTAYDPERVVAELEALEDTNTREVYLTKHICLDEAVEIVRRGGVG